MRDTKRSTMTVCKLLLTNIIIIIKLLCRHRVSKATFMKHWDEQCSNITIPRVHG